jgi:hypothetical protein
MQRDIPGGRRQLFIGERDRLGEREIESEMREATMTESEREPS